MGKILPDHVVLNGLGSVLAVTTTTIAGILGISCIVLIQREWLRSQNVFAKPNSLLVYQVMAVTCVDSSMGKTSRNDPTNHPRFEYLLFQRPPNSIVHT